MKNIILLFSLIILLFSCENKSKAPKSNLERLQADRLTIQKQVDSLNNELKKIEKAINKLDTLKKLQKVTTFKTKDSLFNHYIALQGIVASDQNVILRPEMGGTIIRIYVKEGQRVSKGQTLVQLNASSLTDKVNELKTQLSLATTSFERQERLWNQKIGSEMQYLSAKTQKEALENSLNSLYTQIAKMKIKAPFSGVIDAVIPKVGELTGPQTPVIRLINLNNVYIEADIPETFLSVIKKGTPVLVNFISINKQLKAKINKVGNYINPNNRSFKIRIVISNKDHSIKPNLLADLKINDFSSKGVVLPANLIQMNQKGEKFVYSILKDSTKIRVQKRVLDLGQEYENQVLINSGLKANEQIVLEGGKFVKDGDEVELSK
jgi:RND family efflux transporter MFP subunit